MWDGGFAKQVQGKVKGARCITQDVRVLSVEAPNTSKFSAIDGDFQPLDNSKLCHFMNKRGKVLKQLRSE